MSRTLEQILRSKNTIRDGGGGGHSAPSLTGEFHTTYRYTIKSSVFCSRFSRGTPPNGARGTAPKAAFAEEPKESGQRIKRSFGRWIVLEGPQPVGVTKPQAERASAGRRKALSGNKRLENSPDFGEECRRPYLSGWY